MKITRNAACVVIACALIAACQREERSFRVSPPSLSRSEGVRVSDLQPGPVSSSVEVQNSYERNAPAMSEGKKLFQSFNCTGCHANGGGGMGPALIDDNWRYGSESSQIFATIMEGRPNGMPSFRGKLSDDQAWKITAFVRSMGSLVTKDAAPARDDHMKSNPPPNSIDPQKPKGEKAP